MARERWWLPTGNHEENLKRGLGWLDTRVPKGATGLVALYGKRNIGMSLGPLVGPDVVGALKRGEAVALPSGGRLLAVTLRTAQPEARTAVAALCCFGDDDLVEEVEQFHALQAILAIQWAPTDLAGWRRAFSPAVLGEASSATTPPEPEISPVVREGLRTLSKLVNVSTGISHRDDRALAIEIFQKLDRAQEEFDAADIRAWLIGAAGWRASAAQDVAEIAARVRDGRRFNTHGRGWVLGDDVVEKWRARVDE